MVDLYGSARKYERLRAQIRSWPLPGENRRHLLRYLSNCVDRRSPGRRLADLWLLKKLFVGTRVTQAYVVKPLSLVTIEDLRCIRARFDAELRSRYTYRTLASHLRNLFEDAFGGDPSKQPLLDMLFRTGRRRFFRWSSDTPVNTGIDTDRFYTEKEFLRVLRAAARPKERALLALAWESTARPNEYLSLRVRDVEELPQGFRFRAHISKKRGSQTATRYLYVFSFRADFNAFWRVHAFRGDPAAPLFYREDNARHFGQALAPCGANKILKRLDRVSGVRKNGTLYFLRHGGYSWKRLRGMNPALAGRDMGWAPGGREERRYLHLREDDLLAERLRLADERFDAEVKPPLKARTCPFCNATNSPADDRCVTCGQTLSLQDVLTELATLRRTQEELIEKKLEAILAKHGVRM